MKTLVLLLFWAFSWDHCHMICDDDLRKKSRNISKILFLFSIRVFDLMNLHVILFKIGCVAQWLATCARKPKVPGSSPAASYAQRWALCSNHPANV